MKKWNKQEAIEAIQKLINQIPSIIQSGRKSQEHVRWIANTMRIIDEIFGEKSRYSATMRSFTWSFHGNFIYQGWGDPNEAYNAKHKIAFKEQMQQASGLLLSAIDHLESSEMEEVFEGDKHQEAGELFKIIGFSTTKLRKLLREAPIKEKDVQDKYEDLLITQDIEYSREFPRIEYSSKQYVPDFSFENIRLAVEIKLCKNAGDEKAFIGQINDDILAYKTKFDNLLFIVYDLGQIRDADVFKSSFESHSNVIVQVVKH